MEKDLQTLGKDQRMAEWVHLIENIVFLELLRRGNKVNIGKLGGNEVNFITRGSTGTVYYQVARPPCSTSILCGANWSLYSTFWITTQNITFLLSTI